MSNFISSFPSSLPEKENLDAGNIMHWQRKRSAIGAQKLDAKLPRCNSDTIWRNSKKIHSNLALAPTAIGWKPFCMCSVKCLIKSISQMTFNFDNVSRIPGHFPVRSLSQTVFKPLFSNFFPDIPRKQWQNGMCHPF